MQLLAHRGIWKHPEQKNTQQALSDSFDIGVGVETDVRDCDGVLVISHDPPRGSCSLLLDDLLQIYVSYPTRPILALNIKADGLQEPLRASLQRYGVDNYFAFDMSVPDTLGYQQLQMPFAARISEYESDSLLSQSAAWIWLDAFHGEWFDNSLIESFLERGKRVAVVSPELHRRPHLPLWQSLKSLRNQTHLYLCTDLVVEAREFFNAVKN